MTILLIFSEKKQQQKIKSHTFYISLCPQHSLASIANLPKFPWAPWAPSQNSLLNMMLCCLLLFTISFNWDWSFLPPWCWTYENIYRSASGTSAVIDLSLIKHLSATKYPSTFCKIHKKVFCAYVIDHCFKENFSLKFCTLKYFKKPEIKHQRMITQGN